MTFQAKYVKHFEIKVISVLLNVTFNNLILHSNKHHLQLSHGHMVELSCVTCLFIWDNRLFIKQIYFRVNPEGPVTDEEKSQRLLSADSKLQVSKFYFTALSLYIKVRLQGNPCVP